MCGTVSTRVSDLFPAVVAVYTGSVLSELGVPFSSVGLSDSGGKIFSDSRVIVHKNLVIVGINSARGPVLGFRAEVAEVFKDNRFTRVLTTNGDLVVFAPSKGCGCGSRLRSWNPYGNIVSA